MSKSYICSGLTKAALWSDSRDPHFVQERVVTWARYPYRYLLTEYMSARTELPTPLFVLDRAKVLDDSLGLHEVTRFYIVAGQLAGVIRSYLPPLEEVDEEKKTAIKEGMRLVVEHGLYAPNAEDELEAEDALHIGYMDGVSPVEFGRNG
jgi:hypothetical protein